MASTLDRQAKREAEPATGPEVVAVIDEQEFDDARRDPRVRSFLTEADAYLDELERKGRNG